ncbi:hypothetical protein AYI68_g4273 [Smittium mucronatum]|uniref:Uncharacterized protein n=1 Tax=Smittium mucronatum TaxID=133383 RepID=A0A1R0GXK0_9FUNG|nr:hypothetical protein AYI68_g4273 [Smittium mucronatum]
MLIILRPKCDLSNISVDSEFKIQIQKKSIMMKICHPLDQMSSQTLGLGTLFELFKLSAKLKQYNFAEKIDMFVPSINNFSVSGKEESTKIFTFIIYKNYID